MKSVYEKTKVKNILNKFLFVVTSITTSLIITYVVIFLIIPMFAKPDIIPAQIFIFGNGLSAKVQDEINNAISMNIENIYNRLLSNIQFSIAFFSAALVIFAIVFGVIYFSKIRDAENLIKEIQKTPDLFFKQFYREQYNKNISNLFLQDHIKRNDAINKLAFNPEINIDDYNLVHEVMSNELNGDANVYSSQNINTLINILVKLDYSKTISLLITVLQTRKYESMKHNNLLVHIIANNSEEAMNFVKDKLFNDNEVGTQLLSLLVVNSQINAYLDYILEYCNGQILQQFIGLSYSEMWHIRTDKFCINLLKRKDIDTQCLQSVVSHKSLSISEKISMAFHFFTENSDKFSPVLSYLISTINSDEEAKKEFIAIAEKHNCQESLKEFFAKNNSLKSYFVDFQANEIFTQPTNEVVKISSLEVIEKYGLFLNEDKTVIIDRNGKEYKVIPHSLSIFPNTIIPLKFGVKIDEVFIDIEELKSQ